MKKTKNGEVIASLTEVKNKTGDIFALADEFGEVILTSYNKPRYKIIKLNVSNLLDEEVVKSVKPRVSVKEVKKEEVVKAVVEEPKREIKVVKKEDTSVNELGDVIDDEVRLDTWNRVSEKEMKYVESIVKPLIS